MCYNCIKALYSNYLTGVSYSKSVQHDAADGHPRPFCRSHTEFSMLLITIKSRENSNRQYSPKYTKEENIIGGKEKTVSPDTVLKIIGMETRNLQIFLMQYYLVAVRSSNHMSLKMKIRKRLFCWNIGIIRKVLRQSGIISRYKKVDGVWSTVCVVRFGVTGAYPLCYAAASHGIRLCHL